VHTTQHSVLLALFCALLLGVTLPPRAARAQHPLCPPPAAEDTYFYTCRPNSADMVARFIYDFTVRHLFKSPDTLEIPSDKLLAVLGLQKILDPSNADVTAFLAKRDSVTFTPLDRTTGEFVSKGSSGAQTLTISNDKFGVSLELSLPETVQGLYWRSPDALEAQFYKGHGIRFHISGANASDYEDDIQCISITRARIRATTGDPTHRYLMGLFDKCP